jgi:integrase
VAALHADSVGTIIKRAVSRAGFDAKGFAGHSLRAGFATQAARNGATVFDIMRQTGHRSVQTVARYVRDAQIFHDSPAQRLGLERNSCSRKEIRQWISLFRLALLRLTVNKQIFHFVY